MVEISIPAAPERKNVIHEMVKTPETTVTASKFNTSNLEEELAKSMKQIMEATKKGNRGRYHGEHQEDCR